MVLQPSLARPKKTIFLSVGISFFAVQVIFLLVLSLVYGSQYEIEKMVHLTVDFDYGLIGSHCL